MIRRILIIVILVLAVAITGFLLLNIKIVDFREYKIEDYSYSRVSFSPDSRLLTYATDNQIAFLDVPGLSLARRLNIENSYPYTIVWSNDKNYLASTGRNGNIKLWKMPETKLFYTLSGNVSRVVNIQFSLDNKLLVVGELDDIHSSVETRIWTVADGKLLKTIKGSVMTIFSPDGILIATLEKDARSIKIKNFITDTLITSFDLDGLVSSVTDFTFSPDSSTIAFSTRIDKAHAGLQIWQIKNRQLLYSTDSLDDVYDSIAFSPDGKYLACGRADFGDGVETHAKDPSIDIRRVSDGVVVQKLSGHKRDIINVVYSPDGKYLASSSRDGTARLWTLK